jgi:uncharacterized protein YbjQ (UPF0145 family)
MKIRTTPLLLLAPLFVVGCGASRVIPLEAGSFRSPRLADAAKNMVVLQAQDAGRPTEVIGVIDVHEPTGEHDAALQTLRERAALIGADAVLGIEFHHEGDEHDAKESKESKDIETHLSGLAVRFRPVLQDRPYEVLGQVQVEAAMEHEDDGLRSLRDKGNDMNADAMLDVQFHHGEGKGGNTKLTAIAIRYRK